MEHTPTPKILFIENYDAVKIIPKLWYSIHALIATPLIAGNFP